jgi:hypothetical protein
LCHAGFHQLGVVALDDFAAEAQVKPVHACVSRLPGAGVMSRAD